MAVATIAKHEPRQHDEGVGCSCGKEWPCPTLSGRRAYLGGPDMAAVVGVSRFGSAIDIWRSKVEGTERELTERMAWGQRLEDAIADGYEERTGRKLQKRHTPVLHRVYPFLGGSPDRWIVGESGLVEIKVTAGGWSEIPPDIEVQCQWYMALTGRAFCDVVVLTGLSKLSIDRLDRDDKLIVELIDEGVDFWQNHVLTGEPPEIDGSAGYRKYLAAKYPRDDGLEIVATAEQALLVDELRTVVDEQNAAAERRELLENRLKDAIGSASTLIGSDFRVTWKATKDRTLTDWRLIADGLLRQLPTDEQEALVGLHTVTQPGPRVFRMAAIRREGAAA